MKEIYVVSDNIISPVGKTSEENFKQLSDAKSGIRLHDDRSVSSQPFYAALFDQVKNNNDYHYPDSLTPFEELLIQSIAAALKGVDIPVADERTVLIISTTKGNISLLEKNKKSNELVGRMALSTSANRVAQFYNIRTRPLIVSNACISGLLGIITGMRLIQSGQYDHAIISGADLITSFIFSGFQSFQAVSAEPCKPFDKNRTGITLGEGAATIILSSDKKFKNHIRVGGGSTSNDANHISGPSRTGAELANTIAKAIRQAGFVPGDIDYISAHGTATIYNDEMESRAISLSGLEKIPVNSLKGYFGHTLGAAGLIESAITLQQMKNNQVLPSKGFEESGVSHPINVAEQLLQTDLDCCLKIASGFGGCNGALVFNRP